MSKRLEKKVLEHERFNLFAWIVIGLGILLWLVAFFRAYDIAQNTKRVSIGGSPEMVRRTLAINDAIQRGESQYSYQSVVGPAPMAVNQEK